MKAQMADREKVLISDLEIQRQRQIARNMQEACNGKHYFIHTYGCQMNAQDSQHIAGMLQEMGYQKAARQEDADIIFFNTCCVRDNAERRVLGNVGFLRAMKKEKTNLVLAVCGCMMQEEGMQVQIRKQYPFVDLCFGPHDLYRLPELLSTHFSTGKSVFEIKPVNTHGIIAEQVPIARDSKISNYVTIMYGCNNYCSYCIVPYVRGRERSRNAEDIVREVDLIAQSGVPEIMLLGQNVNSYGNDLENGRTFSQLLAQLDGKVPRIRFMTSHPKDLSDDLIDTIAKSKSICHHIHLPLQSGSNRILHLMNRRYTTETYIGLVEKIRKAIPDISLTTDLIVGFPTETEEDFEDTLRLVRTCRFDSAFTFNYSPRKGTKAAEMEGQIPQEVMTERIQRLISLQDEMTQENYKAYLGKTFDVLVEGVSRRDENQLMGKISQGITVNFIKECVDDLVGKIVPVEIQSMGHNTLRGAMKN